MNISEAVGQHVRLTNDTDQEGIPGKVRIHAHGKLEGPDDSGEYYVRIGEDPQGHGSNGVGFAERNLSGPIFRQSSGIIEITLKG